MLAEFRDPADAAYLVSERIGLVSDRMGIAGLQTASRRCRVYAGYAGWGPGQLEDELRLALSHAGFNPPRLEHVRRHGGILPSQREILNQLLAPTQPTPPDQL